jgi:putative Holliday junction resolvase
VPDLAPASGTSPVRATNEAVFLGFDPGTRLIGIAIANSVTRRARPLQVLRADGATAWPAIAQLIAQWRPARLIVGHPRNDDGSALPMTSRSERFARQLRGRFGIQVELVDERFSSAVVEGGADDAAAAVVLQQWLDRAPSPLASGEATPAALTARGEGERS